MAKAIAFVNKIRTIAVMHNNKYNTLVLFACPFNSSIVFGKPPIVLSQSNSHINPLPHKHPLKKMENHMQNEMETGFISIL